MTKTRCSELEEKYHELGRCITKLAMCQPIIQIHVDATLNTLNGFGDEEDNDRKIRFLGRQYLDLVESLGDAGIVTLPENFKKGLN